MARIQTIPPESATDPVKALYNVIQSKLGMVPNMMRGMAHSPAVLEGYLQFSAALTRTTLPLKIREQIALAVSQANGCEYCLAAHTAGAKVAGLTPDQIRDSRMGTAIESKSSTLLQFAVKLVNARGRVTDADVNGVRAAGFTDVEITEVLALVALGIFTNYFNIVGDFKIDFPAVPKL